MSDEHTVTPWVTDLMRMIDVLGRNPLLAQVNRPYIEALKASVAAGVPDESSFRAALSSSGLCSTTVQLDGMVERAQRRHTEALASRDPGQVRS